MILSVELPVGPVHPVMSYDESDLNMPGGVAGSTAENPNTCRGVASINEAGPPCLKCGQITCPNCLRDPITCYAQGVVNTPQGRTDITTLWRSQIQQNTDLLASTYYAHVQGIAKADKLIDAMNTYERYTSADANGMYPRAILASRMLSYIYDSPRSGVGESFTLETIYERVFGDPKDDSWLDDHIPYICPRSLQEIPQQLFHLRQIADEVLEQSREYLDTPKDQRCIEQAINLNTSRRLLCMTV